MAATNGVLTLRRSLTRSSRLRRLRSPVSGSVDACSWLWDIARITPRRDPICVPVASSRSRTAADGGAPSGPVAWRTPIVRPRIATGVQTAEQAPPGRSRSRGHAPTASLEAKTVICPRLTAAQPRGAVTAQPGPAGSGPATRAR